MTAFHRVDGELHVEQVPLKDIAEHYGTPTFVYARGSIVSAYRDFTRAFNAHPHRICYAVKANSNIAVLHLLAGLGAAFDIVSGGELERVIAAGGDPGGVVFSGVGKQDWELLAALDRGIACFNVESASELATLARLAAAKGQVAPVSVRVNPDVDPETHPYIATGLRESKFGVAPDEALSLYLQAKKLDSIKIIGVDCHIGSQITDLAPFLAALTRILALVDELQGHDIAIEHIDLGGGLGVCYRDEIPLDLTVFAGAILQKMNGRKEQLVFEPGRVIVANSGVLLTRVNTLKSNGDKHFAVVDAAMNDLARPALYQAWHDVSTVGKSSGAHPAIWDLVGPVCESGDFLARARQLSIMEGDLLAVHSVGAYGFVMSSNYNTRSRAPEVLVSGNEHFCIRRRETIADQLRLEAIPDLPEEPGQEQGQGQGQGRL